MKCVRARLHPSRELRIDREQRQKAKCRTNSEKVEESWDLEDSRCKEYTPACSSSVRPRLPIGKERLLLFSAEVRAGWVTSTWHLDMHHRKAPPLGPSIIKRHL